MRVKSLEMRIMGERIVAQMKAETIGMSLDEECEYLAEVHRYVSYRLLDLEEPEDEGSQTWATLL